jgi:O-antigen ligase
MVAASMLAPEKFNSMIGKYADAFSAIGGVDGVDDPSANARILQTAVALPLVEDNIFFGTGSVSNQWNDGYKGLFGYFHPSDLGVLGIIFVYGVFGFAIFIFQYILMWRQKILLISAIHSRRNTRFLLAIMACLLFMLFSSITTGSFAFSTEQSLFFLAILRAGTANISSQMRSITRTKFAQLEIQSHA